MLFSLFFMKISVTGRFRLSLQLKKNGIFDIITVQKITV